MFRIDRNLVNLAAKQYITVDTSPIKADAAGEAPEAAAFNAQRLRAEIEEQASERAREQAREQAEEILCRAQDDAYAKALQIINEAKHDAAALIAEAREQTEIDRRAAWQEGYADGAEEGRRSYDERIGDKKREDDEMLRRVIEELRNERTNTYDKLENDVIGLAMGIARKIIDPATGELGDYFEAMITSALRQMDPEGKITIRVSPAEHERFFANGSGTFELEDGTAVTATIVRDATQKSGDCIIDAGDKTVNAGLDSQLRRIELAFSQAGR